MFTLPGSVARVLAPITASANFLRPLRHALILAICLLAPGAQADTAEWDWQGVERVIAIGDVHGDYDNYLEVLRQAGVIDRRGRWSAGATHLVQLGDVPDRGPDTDEIIAHLQKLEREALKAGGRVHALIGNHEAMNVVGDLRYVHPGEYEALRSRRSKSLRHDYYARVLAYLESQEDTPEIDEDFREGWLERHPLGYVEHRQLWHPEGEFGSWVSSHNTVIRINRTLFLHAGISPEYRERSLLEINEQVRQELREPAGDELRIIDDENGPLWYRGLAMGEETPEIEAHLARLKERFDVDRIVVGHTPGFGTVVPRYDGAVLAADSGISAHYGGYLASVLIEDGRAYTVQRGERVPIPTSNEDRLEYLRAINVIQPGVNNLQYLIRELEGSPPDA